MTEVSVQFSSEYPGTVHQMVLVGADPVKVDFNQQIDDLLITTPDGDVFVSWAMSQFDESKCNIVGSHDNLKEIGNIRCDFVFLRAKDPNVVTPLKVYLTAQNN